MSEISPFFDFAPILSLDGQRTSVPVVSCTRLKNASAVSLLRPPPEGGGAEERGGEGRGEGWEDV